MLDGQYIMPPSRDMLQIAEAELSERVRTRWRNFARPEQCIPQALLDGLKTYWLILSGRGWGKTRVGAETVREWVKTNKYVNIIGATADDARDIMIEGESGILAVCPRAERPTYKSSARKLLWPNGAKTLIFTADEPERLRGKQHMKLWCLAGDTAVLMGSGSEKQLQDVVQGDLVMTRKGPRRVVASMLTKYNAQVYLLRVMGRRDIIGTADHPVYVIGQGFVPLSLVKPGDQVCAATASNGAARHGIATATATMSRWFGFIGRFGKQQTAQYRKARTSITSTATSQTTGLRTLVCWRIATIAESILLNTSRQRLGFTQGSERWQPSRETTQSAGSAVWYALFAAGFITAQQFIRQRFAPATVLSARGLVHSMTHSGYANAVERSTLQRGAYNGIAPRSAAQGPRRIGKTVEKCAAWCALVAARSFNQIGRTLNSAVGHAHCVSTATIVSVEKLATRIPVYDIAVEGEPEFFANGVLVHNCDEMAAWRYVEAWDQAQFGLRLGRHPQAVITTTPRPTKELRELYKDPATFVTLGTTYDNRANLAPAFFDKIIRRYEGTRMGRQELHAEILEDNPNALWKRADIDSARILPVDLPELQRIVIGLDPSVSDSAEHDLAGIVAVGRGAGQWRDHGYVLADKSILATPLGWARQTIALYGDLKADRVIGEINNGGAMIEVTLRVVDPNVSYKQVTASRGKLTRAEPCASMYEQHRMHHVGMFPGLEDELCDYDQLSDKPSPNRMDALVWAHYELFGEQIAGQGLFDLLQHQYDEHQKKLAEDKLFEDM